MTKLGRLRSESQLIALLALVVIFFLSILFTSELRSISERALPVFELLRALALGVYILLVLRFLQNEGLISEYDPQQRLAEIVSSYLGPVFVMVVELAQVLVYLQLSELLFRGITFNEWEHSLSGPNIVLLTGLSLAVLIIALLNLFSRLRDIRHSWDNIAEVVESNQIQDQD